MAKTKEAIWNSATAVRSNPTRPGYVLGFHGTDESIVRDIVLGNKELLWSNNKWDWIGHGIYFWEHSVSRAIEYANISSKRQDSVIKKPAVLGAVLDLGNCLDLLDYHNLNIVKIVYRWASENQMLVGLQNHNMPGTHTDDLVFRNLDCAVIEAIHAYNSVLNLPTLDSVKAVFWEGQPLYPNAGFREKNHIQICIRNPDCIKGYFIPRT